MPSKPKTRRKEIPETKRAAVITWHKAGKSYSQISILEALPRSTVSTIVRRAKLRPQNPTASKKRAGRPRKTSARNERNLCRIAETDNETNLIALSTPSKSGHQLHRQTTRKILARGGLFRRKARKKPYLSPKHKKTRRLWCKERKHWSKEQWRSVIWTDESTFEVGKEYRTVWVTRRAGDDQAFLDKNCKPTFKSGRTSVGVWGAFSGVKKGPLVVLGSGRMNQHRYREEILAQHGLPFYRTVKQMQLGKEEVHWMEDGARYHNTKANQKWRATKSFEAMPWPAQSPDLNPIENLWAIIKRRISKKRHKIRTAEEMGIAIQKEWELLTEADYLKCIDSMQERVRRCLKAKGGPIKY